MSSSPATVLVVDDDFELLSALQRAHTSDAPGWDLACLEDPKTALELFSPDTSDIAVVVLDLVMPEIEGLELLRKIRQIRPELPTLVMTALSDTGSHDAAIALGARAVLQKPLTYQVIRAAIEELLPPTAHRRS